MRLLLGLAAGVVIGGYVGYAGWLCPDGMCPLTGSWQGGSMVGGLLGLLTCGRW